MRPTTWLRSLVPLALLGLAAGNVAAAGTGGGKPAGAVKTAPAWHTILRAAHPLMGLGIDLRGPARAAKWAYTADYYANSVLKFGTGGARLGSWQYSPPALYKLGAGVAVGGSGNVFVADPMTKSVLKFNPSGTRLATFTGFELPLGVAVDRSGNIFVADQAARSLVKLSPGGAVLARWSVPWAGGSGVSAPFGVAVDRLGRIFVATRCTDTACQDDHGDVPEAVIRLNSAGVMQSNLVGSTPHGGLSKEQEPWVVLTSIAVDAAGTLYVGGLLRVGSTFTEGILTYSDGAYRSGRYTIGGIGAPTGIAVDGKGSIYVARDSQVLRLDR